jgi:hypothetical protein
MKKLSILFACVAMSFTLGVAGCKKKEEKTEAQTTTEPAKPADPAAAKPTEGTPPADPSAAKPADPAAAPTEPAAAGGDLPAECNEYKGMIEKLASCDKLPQQSRDALKQGYETMAQGWTNVGAMPEESKTAMADACKKGTESVKAAAAAMCGW